jgi:Phage integrase, N-terminal SAM-like domain
VVGRNALSEPIPDTSLNSHVTIQRSPELISYEEVINWLYHLITERQLSASNVNVAVNAVRFLYGMTLGRNTEELTKSVPLPHRASRATGRS